MLFLQESFVDNEGYGVRTRGYLCFMFGKIKQPEKEGKDTQVYRNQFSNIDFTTLLSADLQSREHAQVVPDTQENPLATIEDGIIYLGQGDFIQASQKFQQAVFFDLDNDLFASMLKMTDYWVEKLRRCDFLPWPERSEFLFQSWNDFSNYFCAKLPVVADQVFFSIKNWVLDLNISLVKKSLHEHETVEKLLLLARSYKMKGNYDIAIEVYDRGFLLTRDHAGLLAELADCYAVVDQETEARILFREAFFYSADKIEVGYLESAMVLNLIKKVKEQCGQDFSLEWVGVYGVLWGIFNVSRELKPAEYAQMNQSIHMLRNEIEEVSTDQRKVLVPKLIYRLFWLIDYYKNLNGDVDLFRQRIQASLLDIRFLDERIFQEYRL